MSVAVDIDHPSPACNVLRRNEPVAANTFYAAGTPAVGAGGVKTAQFFCGRKSLVIDTHGMKSNAEFVNTLEDVIRKRGAWIINAAAPLCREPVDRAGVPNSEHIFPRKMHWTDNNIVFSLSFVNQRLCAFSHHAKEIAPLSRAPPPSHTLPHNLKLTRTIAPALFGTARSQINSRICLTLR